MRARQSSLWCTCYYLQLFIVKTWLHVFILQVSQTHSILSNTVRLCRDLAFTKAVYLSCFTVSLSHCAPLKGFICHVSLIHNGEMREFSSSQNYRDQLSPLSSNKQRFSHLNSQQFHSLHRFSLTKYFDQGLLDAPETISASLG